MIVECLTSNIKSYHYVLPTQLLCKSVDPKLNAHSLQVAWGAPGAFDARTVAHEVIVPFDRKNQNVLGGSPEPYVNNPLRCPAVIAEYRGQQKNQADWDKLVHVLDIVEASARAEVTAVVLEQVLIEIRRLLAHVTVIYPVPSRVSLDTTQRIINDFVAVGSGGDRLEAVCTAMFRTIGEEFGLFDRVERERVNAADAQVGKLADIECWQGERLLLLVEVKDRTLTLTHVDSTLERARSRGITEILFVAEQGRQTSDAEAVAQKIDTEFRSGQNVYVTTLPDFSLGVLILMAEAGRVRFLREIGAELERTNSAIQHRRTWAELLRNV